MREIDELYADSGEPVKESRGVSRGTALKVGGIGLAGALAAFMPGRAGASVKKHASNAVCSGTGDYCLGSPKVCGYDPGICFCATIIYGKIRPPKAPVGACIENGYCDDFSTCVSAKDCPLGTVCTSTCCDQAFGYGYLCAPYCQQGSQGQAPPRIGTANTAGAFPRYKK